MARDPYDELITLDAFEAWRREHPDAALVLGIVREGDTDTSVVTQFGLVGCGPVELVAAANDLLEAAAERLRVSQHESALPFLLMVESARAALALHAPETMQ